MEYLYPINLINRQGKVVLAYTVDEVLDFVDANGWFQKEWMTTFYLWDFDFGFNRHPSRPYIRRGESYTNEWIARDDRGRVVDPLDFTPRARSSSRWVARYERRQKEIRNAAANGLPIPGVHRYSRHRSYVRKPNGGRGVRARAASLKEYDDKCLKMQTNEYEI